MGHFLKHTAIGLVGVGAALAWSKTQMQADLEKQTSLAVALPYVAGGLLVAIGVKVLG
jgi:hypothetical protein